MKDQPKLALAVVGAGNKPCNSDNLTYTNTLRLIFQLTPCCHHHYSTRCLTFHARIHLMRTVFKRKAYQWDTSRGISCFRCLADGTCQHQTIFQRCI